MAPKTQCAAVHRAPMFVVLFGRELVLAVVVLIALGCQKQEPAAAPAPTAASAPAPASAVDIGVEPLKTGIGAADQSLADKVKSRLAADPRFHGASLDVDAQGGRVTVWGHLPSTELRNAAGQVAHQTPGVSSIANLIAVDPPASAPSPGH
jgi:hypothetical protein